MQMLIKRQKKCQIIFLHDIRLGVTLLAFQKQQQIFQEMMILKLFGAADGVKGRGGGVREARGGLDLSAFNAQL